MKSLFCKLLFVPLVLVAKPSGMQVVSGKASCKEQAGEFVINSGKRAVVKWDEFSIGKGETVRFVQPDSKSAILNRVTGARSELLGQLHSNGKVYLLNPKGILIGKDAIINTAAFVASTLDVLDEDFLRGKELLFSGSSKEEIINLGVISCLQGDVALIAHRVSNKGKIEGDFVGLASSPEILLHPEGNQRIFIKAKGGDSVNQDGEVKALVSELRSGSVYDHAICCRGNIEAVARKEVDGRIYLVAEEGRTTLEGKISAPKGEVQILGNEVLLTKTADVDVSSESGGGTILVGGDTDPENCEIFTSDYTWIAKGANLRADALEEGDGGRIICWGNKFANVFGTFSLRGGEHGGDGGFVEISSRENVPNYQGTSDRRAPKGKNGKLVLDPDADIEINSTGSDSGGAFSGSGPITYTPSAASAVILVSTLETELGMGNVLVQTASAPSSGPNEGEIKVSNDVTWSTANTLELHGAAKVEIDSGVTISNTSSIAGFTAMNFHNDGTSSVNLNGVALQSGATLSSISGGITLNGTGSSDGTSSTLGVALQSSSSIVTTSGNVSITGLGGPGIGSNFGVHLATSASIATSSGNITLTGTGGAGSSTVNHGLFLDTSSVMSSSGAISFTGTGNGGFSAGVNLVSGTVTNTTGAISISGEGNGTNSAGVDFDGSIVTTGGALTIEGAIGSSVGNGNSGILITGSSTCTVTGSGDLTFTGTSLGDGTGTDNYGIFMFGAPVITSTSASTGNITLNGVAGPGTDDNCGIRLSSALFTSTTGNTTLNGNQTPTLPVVTGESNQGLRIGSATSITTLGTGVIEINGVGLAGTTGNHGVQIEDATLLSSATTSGGSITVNGVAGESSGGTCHGVNIINLSSVTSTTGDIVINGNQTVVPATGGSFNLGVHIAGSGSALTIESLGTGSTAANIAITGSGGDGTSSNRGVQIDAGSVPGDADITSVDGSITIIGTKGEGTNGAIQIQDDALIETTGVTDTGITTNNITISSLDGDIVIDESDVKVAAPQSDISIITSSAGGMISLETTALIEKTGTNGTLTISAPAVTRSGVDAITIDDSTVSCTDVTVISGTKTTNSGRGIYAVGATFTLGTTSTISGTSFNDDGIYFDTMNTITGGSSLTTFNGTVSSTSTSADTNGIHSDGTLAISGPANITMTGRNNSVAAVTGLLGIFIEGGTITYSGPRWLRFRGFGGAGSGDSHGIFADGTATISSSGSGNLGFEGVVNASVAGSSEGISYTSGSTMTTASGRIDLLGRGNGSSTKGIFIEGPGSAITSGGRLDIVGTTAEAGSGNIGVDFDDCTISTTGAGAMVITGTSNCNSFVSGSNTGIIINATDITCTGSGSATITGTGGPGTINNYGISSFGTSTVSTTTGSLDLTGTAGAGNSTGNTGINCLGTAISTTGGALSLTGAGAGIGGTSHGISLSSATTVAVTGAGGVTLDGTAAPDSTDNIGIVLSGSASSITSVTSAISLTGRASGTSSTGIQVTDFGTVSTSSSSPITLETFSDIIIDEGGTVVGGSSTVTVDSDRDLIIRAHTTSADPSAIFLGTGDARISTGRHLKVLGATGGVGSYAQIGSQTSGSTAKIGFPRIGGRLLVDAVDGDSYALIGHGDPAVGAEIYNAVINFGFIGGRATVTGANSGGGSVGFAQIGHIDGAGATLGGNINLRPFGSLRVLGGSDSATSYARIGHGGQGVALTFEASRMLMLVGKNIVIQESAGAGAAEIINPSVIAGSGDLDLVTDNVNPIAPEFGFFGLTFDGTLSATGALKIYTVDRTLNNIINTTINGEGYAPPALEIDNPQEQFGIYFAGGTFSTAAFRIYYKFPLPFPPQQELFYQLATANAQLQDLLPLFRYMRLPNYPFYHTNMCEEFRRGIRCDPGFDPYTSLNFQDDVCWIGDSQ